MTAGFQIRATAKPKSAEAFGKPERIYQPKREKVGGRGNGKFEK
jgi:hypothetical protein